MKQLSAAFYCSLIGHGMATVKHCHRQMENCVSCDIKSTVTRNDVRITGLQSLQCSNIHLNSQQFLSIPEKVVNGLVKLRNSERVRLTTRTSVPLEEAKEQQPVFGRSVFFMMMMATLCTATFASTHALVSPFSPILTAHISVS